MTRSNVLEANNYAMVREVLAEFYGSDAAKLQIEGIDAGSESFCFKIGAGDNPLFLKIAYPSKHKMKEGLPEHYAQYLAQHGVPTISYIPAANGDVFTKMTRNNIPAPALHSDIASKMNGAVATLSRMIPGETKPKPEKALIASNGFSMGNVLGTIARSSDSFLAQENLALKDIPPNGYNIDDASRILRSSLNLEGLGNAQELVQALKQPDSPASRRLAESIGNMRANADLMTQMAAGREGAEVLRNNGQRLRIFAEQLEKGYALQLLQNLAMLEQVQPALDARPKIVCHGDAAGQNMQFKDGRFTGILDFGEMQQGDKLQGDLKKAPAPHLRRQTGRRYPHYGCSTI